MSTIKRYEWRGYNLFGEEAKTCAFCLDLRAKAEIIKARRGE